jgi:hypothetical protein
MIGFGIGKNLDPGINISDPQHWYYVINIYFTDTGGAVTSTGGAVCKGATPSVEQPGGRGFKPRLRSLLD